ncbi:unnamed protein product [Euphydryas editha]|uniref:YEATS domain-containing protein n=1 Tax=Euphydryas editha TaxID=104508 RepID=A0AAU9TNK5_EUPED|nr:unnamed protein product [Euphydryas editha]
MSTIKVNIEIGHVTKLKSKKTPEGFTHDWEIFVRGIEGADISHFVEKVVFKLHETFQKPRRVVKEPPFSIKESGYAGFVLPIELYLKNKEEPKKITFMYDLTIQHGGILKDRYIFENPNDEFRRRLLKGGGIVVDKNAFYTNPEQESRSRDSFTEEKPQIVNKTKQSSDNVKKHKSKEFKEEPKTSSFENLFGPPIQKPPKVSPDPKKLDKNLTSVKTEKRDKERSSSDKKVKNEHKEIKPDKLNIKEDKLKIDKTKNHSRDQDRVKEKASKRQSDRPPSPELTKKKCPSPNRKLPSPLPRSSSAASIKEEYKPTKHNSENIEQKKQKSDDRIPEIKIEKDTKEKKKKDKKSHDRDKERREKKEHKKESHKNKDSPKEPLKELPKEVTKSRDIIKEKEIVKSSPIKEKPLKPEKTKENIRKTPQPQGENLERHENHNKKEKGETEKKHKHKKKDKKRDESKERHKESGKDRKHKHDKVREMPIEKPDVVEHRETPIQKDRPLPEPTSPISIDTASQCSSKSGLNKAILIGTEDINSSHSDSDSVSMIADEEDIKVKIENPSPKIAKREPSPEPEPEPELEPEIEPEPEPVVEAPPVPQKDKYKKHKDKSKREEKRRKRKAAEEEDIENIKIAKTSDARPSNNETEHGESSGSTIETKVQDNGVSSSLGEDAEPGDLSPDYMVQLRGLQQRIMTIKNNEDLERVVNLIAETGRYEVTTQTFDFDLCLLDRSTVQQLIQLVGC